MSHLINPMVGMTIGTKVSGGEAIWFKDMVFTNQIRTKMEGDKRSFNNIYAYTLYNFETDLPYYFIVNEKHEVLYSTANFEEMFVHIERMKTVD